MQAPLDLDNLHLADLGAAPALEAGYELEALLLTGSCIDIAASSRNAVWACCMDLLMFRLCVCPGRARGFAEQECFLVHHRDDVRLSTCMLLTAFAALAASGFHQTVRS